LPPTPSPPGAPILALRPRDNKPRPGKDARAGAAGSARGDPSSQLNLVPNLRARENVSARVVEKILTENPRRLYGLS
jgi:hypothetical protein